jgi:hypothetical protein
MRLAISEPVTIEVFLYLIAEVTFSAFSLRSVRYLH